MKTLKLLTGISIVLFLMIVACDKNEEEEPCNQTVSIDLGEDQVVQEGMAIVLDAGAAGSTYTYLWNTGATTQTISVTEAGEYSVTVKSCSDEDSDTIFVDVSFPTIKVETDFGNFRIWLYNETPLHKENFLSLTEEDFYNNLIYHRVIYDFVIQGGDPDGTGWGDPGYTIPAEIVDGLNHVYGAVGAARLPDTLNPDRESNGSQYYIVCDPDGRPGLDGDYTVFGLVFTGMETVLDISQVEVDEDDKPLVDVLMKKLTVEYYTAQALKDTFNFDVPE